MRSARQQEEPAARFLGGRPASSTTNRRSSPGGHRRVRNTADSTSSSPAHQDRNVEQFARTKRTIIATSSTLGRRRRRRLEYQRGFSPNISSRTRACSVVGVPRHRGDLKNEHIEASFGFDTATKI